MTETLSAVPAFRRRLLLVGTRADYARFRLDQETRRLLANPALRFVEMEEAMQSQDSLLTELARKNLLQAGALLIQSVMAPDLYTRLSRVNDQTAESKLSVTVKVCQLLGARRVEVRHAELVSSANASKRVISGQSAAIGKGSVDVSASTIEVGGLRIRSAWSFHGGPPDPAEAEQALLNSGLQDATLEEMIDFFRSSNWPISHQFAISTSAEMQRVREVVSDFSVPATFKAHTELESFKAAQSSFEFELWVEFGQLG
jgi:hypothetical protein